VCASARGREENPHYFDIRPRAIVHHANCRRWADRTSDVALTSCEIESKAREPKLSLHATLSLSLSLSLLLISRSFLPGSSEVVSSSRGRSQIITLERLLR
jgi:hypothetical protein